MHDGNTNNVLFDTKSLQVASNDLEDYSTVHEAESSLREKEGEKEGEVRGRRLHHNTHMLNNILSHTLIKLARLLLALCKGERDNYSFGHIIAQNDMVKNLG